MDELANKISYLAEKYILFVRVFMRDIFTSRERIYQMTDEVAGISISTEVKRSVEVYNRFIYRLEMTNANREMTIIIAYPIHAHGQRLSELMETQSIGKSTNDSPLPLHQTTKHH